MPPIHNIMSNRRGDHYTGIVHFPVKFSPEPGVLYTERHIDVATLKIYSTATRRPYGASKIGAL